MKLLDRLELLYSKHFIVERRSKSLRLTKRGRFTRKDLDKVLEIADRYKANVWASGVHISKCVSHRGHGNSKRRSAGGGSG